jgi:hypothetical protein
MSLLLNLGMAAVGLAGVASRAFNNDQEAADPVMLQLTARMDDFEDGEFVRLSPTVGGLYIHWFFSLIAMIECIIRLFVVIVIIAFWSLFIYISCCISCGKTYNMPSEPIILALGSRYSIYSAFLCALIANVVCPFMPTLYFWKRRVTLLRPPGMPRRRPLKVDDLSCISCCLCSCPEFGHSMFISNGVSVPTWKMAEVYLSTVALLHILGDYQCRFDAWPSLCSMHPGVERYLAEASQAIILDIMEDTKRFFQGAYRCDSFETFLATQHTSWSGASSSETAPQNNNNYRRPSSGSGGGSGGARDSIPAPTFQQQQQFHQQHSAYPAASAPSVNSLPAVPPRPAHTLPVVRAEAHLASNQLQVPVVMATPIGPS